MCIFFLVIQKNVCVGRFSRRSAMPVVRLKRGGGDSAESPMPVVRLRRGAAESSHMEEEEDEI